MSFGVNICLNIWYEICIEWRKAMANYLPRTFPGCSVPEPYRSHDWAMVPASPAYKAEY